MTAWVGVPVLTESWIDGAAAAAGNAGLASACGAAATASPPAAAITAAARQPVQSFLIVRILVLLNRCLRSVFVLPGCCATEG